MLAEAVERALSFTSKKEMMIVGGVAANRRLAQMLESVCSRQDAKLFVCPIKFAGDNGAQIAWTALQEYLATKMNVRVEESTGKSSRGDLTLCMPLAASNLLYLALPLAIIKHTKLVDWFQILLPPAFSQGTLQT